MAMADYKKCNVCGCKTFYDARLHWPEVGDELYYEHPITHEQLPYGAGDWAVLCPECAQTHKLIVEKKGE